MRNILAVFFVLMTMSLFATEQDSTSKRSLIVVPIGYYQPETSVALGAAGGYYFKSKDLKKISSISFSAIYTFNSQFIFSVAPKIFSKDKRYYYYADFKARYYPDVFYEIGLANPSIGHNFVSRHANLVFQPQRFLNRYWSVGANYFLRYESPYVDDDDVFMSPQNVEYGGWTPYFIQAIGAVATYDSRDNLFYPEKGFFAKLSYLNSSKKLASDFDLENINLDIRHYLSLGKKHIFAYQLYSTFLIGYAPFQLMPTIGGPDKMRGFREGMFRNKNMALLQGEYRFPIYKRLKGVAFGGVAQVFGIGNLVNDKLKVSYGGGLRYRLNDARVHLRFDYGFTNYKENGFYITATEAF